MELVPYGLSRRDFLKTAAMAGATVSASSNAYGASRKFLPVWEQLVKKYVNDANNGKLIIMKVDVDKDLQLANKYKAATLPTIILQTSDNQVLKYFGSDNLPEVVSFLKRNGI